MPPCVTCGGTVAPDGHCWDCGAPQPAFRSHLERAAPGPAAVTDRARRTLNADAMALAASGPWTIGVVCDGVSMSPRADRAAQVAAATAATVLAARLPAGADAGDPRPQTRSYRPRGPGHLLLCTDGLWRHLPDPAALRDRLNGTAPLDGARSLVQHALDAGATDNTAALLIRLG